MVARVKRKCQYRVNKRAKKCGGEILVGMSEPKGWRVKAVARCQRCGRVYEFPSADKF